MAYADAVISSPSPEPGDKRANRGPVVSPSQVGEPESANCERALKRPRRDGLAATEGGAELELVPQPQTRAKKQKQLPPHPQQPATGQAEAAVASALAP